MKINKNDFYLKYLLKNKIYMYINAILLLLLFVCIFFFSTLNFTGFRLLYLLSRWNYYFSAMISVLAYFVFSIATNASCSEVIDVTSRKKFSWQKGIVQICMVILLCYHVLMISGLFWCSYRNDGTNYFISIIPKSYAMNILFPQLICLGIAYLASCILEKNKILAPSIMLVILIMTSPILETLIWRMQPKGFPIDKIVMKVKKYFGIFYQNAKWAPDTQYGLQTENVRLFLLLFWMLAIFSVVLWITDNRRKRILSIVCMSLALGTLFLSERPASIYRQNESWDGIFADFNYYEMDIQKPVTDSEVEFCIENYDMKVYLKNQLHVDGYFKIISPKARDQFALTLYHGYRIKNLTSKGIKVDFKRQQDKILIKLPQKVNECELEIEYEGYSGKYYSNEQAVMLPGYFPWYPMAGNRQIFVQYPHYSGGNGYNPYNRIEKAKIRLDIQADCEFVTNLEETTENVFVGTADSISIIGGNIKKTDETNFINILPLELNGENEQEHIQKLEQKWKQLLKELEQILDIDTSRLQDKKLIMVSKDMGRNFSNNYLVEFEDYILFSKEYLDTPTYMNYLLQKNGKDSQIGNLFVKAMMMSDKMSAEDIVNDMISEEAGFQQMMDEKENPVVSENLENAVNSIGADQVVKRIVQYLLDSTIHTDADFWNMISNI